MAAIPDTVQPGQIISSDLFNRIIALLNQHDALLAATGSTTPSGLLVTQLVPPGPYRVGDTLTVLGQNFQFGIGAARVFLNGTQVPQLLPGSNDTRLDFVIPPVPGVVEAGTTVDLVVLNQTQSATRQIVLRPIQNPLQGIATVEWQSANPATPVPNAQASFTYRITSGTNNRATWSINAQVDVAANLNLWVAQMSVRDNNGNLLNPAEVVLDPGQFVDVQVRFASIPNNTNGVTFGVTVGVTAGPISASSGIRQFTVGTAIVPPDTSMTLSTLPIFSAGALVGNTLTVPGGQSRILAINADFTVAGNYTVTRSVLGGATGWAVNLDSGTIDNITINANDLTANGHTQRVLRYSVAATGAATTPAQIQVSIQRQGNPGSRAIALNTVRS
jgi:hypothetical protein